MELTKEVKAILDKLDKAGIDKKKFLEDVEKLKPKSEVLNRRFEAFSLKVPGPAIQVR